MEPVYEERRKKVFAFLPRIGGYTVPDLCRHLGLTAHEARKAVTSLERDRYVKRTQDPPDRKGGRPFDRWARIEDEYAGPRRRKMAARDEIWAAIPSYRWVTVRDIHNTLRSKYAVGTVYRVFDALHKEGRLRLREGRSHHFRHRAIEWEKVEH